MPTVRLTFRAGAGSAGRHGVTLIELVIVVLIVGIVAAAAVPKFGNTLDRTRAQAAANRIQQDLKLARQSAISQSIPITITFDTMLHSYSIPALNDLNHPGAAYSVVLAASPYNTLLSTVNLGGDNAVIYDRFGTADSDGTIIVQAGSFQRTVTIDADSPEAGVL